MAKTETSSMFSFYTPQRLRRYVLHGPPLNTVRARIAVVCKYYFQYSYHKWALHARRIMPRSSTFYPPYAYFIRACYGHPSVPEDRPALSPCPQIKRRDKSDGHVPKVKSKRLYIVLCRCYVYGTDFDGQRVSYRVFAFTFGSYSKPDKYNRT